MNERAGRGDGTGVTEKKAMDRLEQIAAKVDEEAERAPEDPRERAVLERMRLVRAALRRAGPSQAPDGFAERVLARMAKAAREAQVVELRRRRDRLVVFAQAASLALLVGVYGTLLATTRVHDIGPRWSEESGGAGARPDAGTAADSSVPAVRMSVATARPLGLDCPPPPRGGGAVPWNSRCSASRMSDSSVSTTKTPTC
ncbi:MAG: hypothetical protein HY905_12125 [Deltaproteobacteria bacterium]|nr:hypothetical protein [Deltaproteobacteria bacterium]